VCALDDLAQPIAFAHPLAPVQPHAQHRHFIHCAKPRPARVVVIARLYLPPHRVWGAYLDTQTHSIIDFTSSSTDATATADAVVTIVSQVLDGDRMAESLYQIHFRGQRKPAAHSSNHDLFH
jgi:hypothetical protein